MKQCQHQPRDLKKQIQSQLLKFWKSRVWWRFTEMEMSISFLLVELVVVFTVQCLWDRLCSLLLCINNVTFSLYTCVSFNTFAPKLLPKATFSFLRTLHFPQKSTSTQIVVHRNRSPKRNATAMLSFWASKPAATTPPLLSYII